MPLTPAPRSEQNAAAEGHCPDTPRHRIGHFVLAAPRVPSRLLLVIDNVTSGAILARDLIAQGHEVTYARDTIEARWAWVRNYFESVIVCANGASGFVERIKKES